jgi:Concanavalin A-like lectin/glucanases superfamily
MLVCSVSQRPRGRVVAADLAEAAAALDASTTGTVVFATLVDDPASVGDSVDAYLGEIMVEAANASASVDGIVPSTYSADVAEAGIAASTQDATKAVADPSFANVKLLLGFEGANASTGAPGMADESPAAHGTATIYAAPAQISTAQFKFGSSSLSLNGVGGCSITFPDSNDWDFGTGQFTIEGFFRFSAAPSNTCLIAQWPGGWAFWFLSGQLFLRCPGGDSASYTPTITLNQWYHIAVDWDASGVLRIYIDGVMRVKHVSFTVNITGSTSVLAVGSLLPGGFSGFDLNGFVDELRITKGVARYASDAGYTVPTSAFPRS